MQSEFWFDKLPLWAVFVFTFAVVTASIFIGTILGRRRKNLLGQEAESAIGTITGSTLGLLAFLLAFTYGIAANFVQIRKQFFLDEVNAISTAYLQVKLLPAPWSTQLPPLIREYVNIRVELSRVNTSDFAQRLHHGVAKSNVLQDEIWALAVELVRANDNPQINAVFVQSLNRMFDLQTSRVAVFQYRIAPIIWHAMLFITILSMGTVGYQVGFSGKSSLRLGIVLAMTFAAVMLLISDLDRPLEGSFQVDRQPIIDLQQKLLSETSQNVWINDNHN